MHTSGESGRIPFGRVVSGDAGLDTNVFTVGVIGVLDGL
jgi:hypothetical protein